MSSRSSARQKSVACSVVNRRKGADSGWRQINVGRAIKALGLKVSDVTGRYELNIHRDELLIVNLTGEQLTGDGQEEKDKKQSGRT